jgi:hypothetical protein
VPEAQRAQAFLAFWKPAMAEWRAQWPNVNSFIHIPPLGHGRFPERQESLRPLRFRHVATGL